MIRAVSFDLDGTLVPGTSTCSHLAKALGRSAAMNELERAYARGVISNSQVPDEDGPGYAGRTKRELQAHLATLPVIAGAKETIKALKDAGLAVFLGTVTWKFIAEYYQAEYGFDAASGVEMGEDGHDKLTGKVTRHFDEDDKVRFVEGLCAARGIAFSECAAVGDSRSDIPLFRRVGLSIAFNATPEAKAAASVSLHGRDFSIVLPHLFERVSAAPTSR